MNTKKFLMVVLLAVILLIVGGTVSKGAYSAGNKTVNSGESFSITVTSTTELEAYNLDLTSYSGLTLQGCSKTDEGAMIDIYNGNIGYVNVSGTTKTLGTYTFKAPEVTKDATYTIKFLVDQATSVTSTITVKAPAAPEPPENNNTKPTEPETPTTPDTPEEPQKPETPATPTKSSNANLSNLGIRPNDFTGFRSGTTSYSVSLPYDVTKIEVYASKGDSAQTISGTGTKSLSEGSNVFEVEVTAEDGTKKTYKITVVRLAKEEQTNPEVENQPEVKVALASIEIQDVTLNEAFNPEVLEYTAKADAKAEKVVVKATANVENAKIEVTGADEYEDGENTIRITVKSEDGTDSKTYVIKVTKEAEPVAEEDENTIVTVAVVTGDNNKGNQGGIGMEKLLFCIGIGVVAILGIVFAVIRYLKDKEDEVEVSEPISFANSFSPKEAIKDVATATSKLSATNLEPASEEAIKKNKGKHF